MAITFLGKNKATPFCSVCKRRPATKLCDFPIGRDRYVGHPPRHLMLESQNSKYAFKKVEMSRTLTCDKALCDACAIHINNEIDLCPTHIQDMIDRRKHQ